MKGAGALILSRARERERANDKVNNDELIGNEMPHDVHAEAIKYDTFWVGIQTRLSMNKKAGVMKQANNELLLEKEKQKITERFIIHPHNPHKVNWDIAMCLFVIYSVVTIPLRIGFDRAPSLGPLIVDYMIDGFFGIDIGVSFNTAFLHHHTEEYVFKRRQIARNYMKFWFWIDLFSTIPFDDIFSVFSPALNNLSSIRVIRILRLGRLAKLQRLHKISDYLEDNWNISTSMINLIVLMMQIFFVIHVFACFFHFLTLPSGDGNTERNWVIEAGLEGGSATELYVASLYYTTVTMLTVGYGDIRPTNQNEKIYSIFAMLSGGMIFGALLSKVAQVLERRNPTVRAYKDNMAELRSFLQEYSVPSAAKARAKEAYSYFLQKKTAFGESSVYDELPQPLLYKLVLQIHEKDIKKVKLFYTYECSFVVPLVINAKPFFAERGEIIHYHGDVCREIVFISSGIVRISVNSDRTDFDTLVGFCTEGDYFGDMEFMRNTVTTLAQYAALANCDLLAVPYKVIKNAMAESVDSASNFSLEMKHRYAAFSKVLKSGIVGKAQKQHHAPGRGAYAAALLATKRTGSGGADKHQHYSPAAVKRLWGNLVGLASSGSYGSDDGAMSMYTVNRRHSDESLLSSPGCHIRRQSTLDAHRTILLNGQVRNHKEGAQYIRLALNAKKNATLGLKQGSSKKNGDIDKESEGILGLLSQADDDRRDGSCRIIVQDEDGAELIRDVTHKELNRMWFIDPGQPAKYRWDLFIALVIFYTVLATPVEIAFFDSDADTNIGFAVDLTQDALFLTDLLFSFRTLIPSQHEDAFIMESAVIAKTYVEGWFWVDLLSSIPYSLIFSAFNELRSIAIIKVLRLFRLLKLARILKVEVFFNRLEDYLGLPRALFELLKVAIEVFLIGHLVACIWWGMSSALSSEPWYTKEDEVPGVYTDLSDVPATEQYLTSLYFTFATMTTVGYGDIYATNTGEMVLNVLLILLGASVFGYIIANVSTILDGFNQVETTHSGRLLHIKEYLNEKDCSPQLAKRVLNHFKKLYGMTSSYNVDKILNRLPPSLRVDILVHHHSAKMNHIPIFRYLENKSLALHIFNLLVPVFYEVDHYIIKQGRDSGEINFFVVGTAVGFKVVSNLHQKGFLRARTKTGTMPYGANEKAFKEAHTLFTASTAPTLTNTAGESGEASKDDIALESINSDVDSLFPVENKREYGEAKGSPRAVGESETSYSNPGGKLFDLNLKEVSGIQEVVESEGPPVVSSFSNKDNVVDSTRQHKVSTNNPSSPPANPNAHSKVTFKDVQVDSSAKVASAVPHSPKNSANSRPDPKLRGRRSSFADLGKYTETSGDDVMETHVNSSNPPAGFSQAFSPPKNRDNSFHKSDGKVRCVGHFSPGDFVGHTSLMNDTVHDISIVATTPCTVFLLSRAVISKLLHSEPVVAMKLQEALANSISAQTEVLGKAQRRSQRAEFLQELKEKVYEYHNEATPSDPTAKLMGVDVSTLMNDLNRGSGSGKGASFVGASDETFEKMTKATKRSTIFAKKQKARTLHERADMSMKAKFVTNVRRASAAQRKKGLLANWIPKHAKIVPSFLHSRDGGTRELVRGEEDDDQEDIGNQPRAPTSYEVKQKLKKLDDLLSEENMKYESDDEEEMKKVMERNHLRLVHVIDVIRHHGTSDDKPGNAHGNSLTKAAETVIQVTGETPRQRLRRLLRKAMRVEKQKRREAEALAASERAAGFGKTLLGSAMGLVRSGTSGGRRGNILTRGATHALVPAAGVGSSVDGSASNVEHTTPDSHNGSVNNKAVRIPRHATQTTITHEGSNRPSLNRNFTVDAGAALWRTAFGEVTGILSAVSAMHDPAAKPPLTYYEMTKIKRHMDRSRRWSVSAIEGHSKISDFRAGAEDRKISEGISGAPTHHGRKGAKHVRRQSFPSIEHEAWLESISSQGV